jgi:hypothetical protein
MSAARSRDARRVHALLVVAGSLLSACRTWRPVGDADPAASLRSAPPPVVRVAVRSWPGPVLLDAPRVVGDSLIGTQLAARGGQRGERVAVPLAAVER